MYKLNLAAMLVLSLSVAGGTAYLSLRKTDPDASKTERIEYLVRSLGDPNPNVRRQAESELRTMGPVTVDALRQAAQSPDREVADRAKRLLREFEPVAASDDSRPEERPVAPVESRGVTVELASQETAGRLRFYVRMTNHDSIPYTVARERVPGGYRYSGFARFEVSDAAGHVTVVPTEGPTASVSGTLEFVVLGAGETLDLYAGQADSMTSLPLELVPGEVRVRFLYDATAQSPYQHVVRGASPAGPLPPQLLASAWVSVRAVP